MSNTTTASYYIDKSGINQKVDAAIIQISHNTQDFLVCLRSTSCYIIYAAELLGILIAL